MYYERRKLLPVAPRTEGGFRLFAPETVERVQFIKQAQDMGLPLDEIAELLSAGGARECVVGAQSTIAPESLPGGYRLAAVCLYRAGNLRALQFKYRSEQGGLCVFQLPSGVKLSFGERPSEQYKADGAYCQRTSSKNCSIYRFVLGETQCVLMTRQTDPAVVGALIQTFNTESEKAQ